eukprot:12597038-Heterocapsa_arctica.AAC.1
MAAHAMQKQQDEHIMSLEDRMMADDIQDIGSRRLYHKHDQRGAGRPHEMDKDVARHEPKPGIQSDGRGNLLQRRNGAHQGGENGAAPAPRCTD